MFSTVCPKEFGLITNWNRFIGECCCRRLWTKWTIREVGFSSLGISVPVNYFISTFPKHRYWNWSKEESTWWGRTISTASWCSVSFLWTTLFSTLSGPSIKSIVGGLLQIPMATLPNLCQSRCSSLGPGLIYSTSFVTYSSTSKRVKGVKFSAWILACCPDTTRRRESRVARVGVRTKNEMLDKEDGMGYLRWRGYPLVQRYCQQTDFPLSRFWVIVYIPLWDGLQSLVAD